MTTQLNLTFLSDAQIRRTMVECYANQRRELTGAELSEAIAEMTRRQYQLVFGSRDIRVRDMTDNQKLMLRRHQIETIRMLLAVQTQS